MRHWESAVTAHHTCKSVYALLSNRFTMMQLLATMESDAATHSGSDALWAKLAIIEGKVYAGTDVVTGSVLTNSPPPRQKLR